MASGDRMSLSRTLAAQLAAGVVPWRSGAESGIPINPANGKQFRGGNAIALLAAGFNDPRWCSEEQARANGWRVRSGEASSVVEYWQYADVVERRTDEGQIEKVRVPRAEPIVKYAHVFNAAQIDGMPERPQQRATLEVPVDERRHAVDSVATGLGISIIHDSDVGAVYDAQRGVVRTRPIAAYATQDEYNADLVRSLAWACGDASRAGGIVGGGQPADGLAIDIAATLMCAQLGARYVAPDPSRQDLGQWSELIGRDPNAIYKAAREAERIAAFALAHGREQVQLQEAQFPTSEVEVQMSGSSKRVVLNVPYHEKEAAKRAGARWDQTKRMWYADAGADLSSVAKWLGKPRELSESDIIDQFADALLDAGLVLDGPPIMDGRWHRTPVKTSRNEKALKGAYIGHLPGGDGPKSRPNGFINNKDTGISEPWVAKGLILTSEQRAEYAAAAVEAAKRRTDDTRASQEKTAKKAVGKWDRFKAATDAHPYLQRKQVPAIGLRIDGEDLVVPLYDAEGQMWQYQTIPADKQGKKLFLKDGRKTGCFHVLGDLAAADTVYFAEGYATGASVHLATKEAVVIVFDSGNISAVMDALTNRTEGKARIVCGDDDVVSPAKMHARLNAMLAVEKTFEKMQLRGIEQEELRFDGVARPAVNNSACMLTFSVEQNDDGIERLVGKLQNTETNGELRLALNNVGREKAVAAARTHGGVAIFPKFASMDGGPSDFNDLHVREGLAAVERQLGIGISRVPAPPAPEVREAAKEQVFDARDQGRYVGEVVSCDDVHVVQRIGRGVSVRHARASVEGTPTVGTVVTLAYSGGRAAIQARGRAADLEKGASR